MSRESILERNRKRAQENDQKMGATALGTSALNYSTQQSLERAAAEKVARESAGGLVDVPQPWLDTITPVTPSSRSARRWSGTTPSSRGGGFGETESQGRGYFSQADYSFLDRANDVIQGGLRQWAGGVGSAAGNVLDRTTSRYNSDAAGQWLDLVQDSMENRDDESYFERPEVQDRLENIRETREQTAPFIQEIYDIAEETGRQGTEQIERAKADLGPVGSFAVDVGTQVPQMLADAAFGAVTGGSALLPLGVRSYGYGVQEAMENGADRDQAAMYGVASGAKEALTEKLFSVALPFSRIYGGGSFDDAIQRGIQTAVERFASTPTGQRIVGGGLSFGASALTEGAEEFISDWLGWQMPRIYGGDVATAEETLSDSLYDFLVGAAVGGLGGVVSPSTYNYQSGTTAASANPTRQAVEMLSRGEEISGSQATRIARDPEALSLLQELTGQEINTDAPISQVRSNIQAVAAARRGTAPVQTQTQENTQAQQGAVPAASQEARPAARQVYDTQRVQRASTALGESGQKALSFAYDGSVDADRYYAGFTAYYEAGLSGRTQDQVRSDYAADLTEAQKFAAYAAGQNDAAASLQREKRAAQFAQTAGEDSGLVYDDFVREAVESGRTVSGESGSGPAYLTQETAERVNSVAKALGLRVRFVDQVDGGRSNAEITGSEVQIEKNNPLPVQFLMGHEVTHRLQELAPEEYRAFREAAAQDEMVQTYVRRYAEGNSGLTYEQALDEAAADYAGRMLEDGALLDQFLERNQDNRTLLEKIRDAIRTLVRKLTGAEKKAAQTAEEKLSAALEAGAKRAETLRERQGDGTMESRYSRKEDGANGRERVQQEDEGILREDDARAEEEDRGRDPGDGEVRSVPIGERYRGVDPTYGENPVRTWVSDGLVTPEPGSLAESEQQTAAEYGIPSFVVSDAVWDQNKGGTPAFSAEGQIFLRENLPEVGRGTYVPHEATHVMKQVGYQPYLDFTQRVPDMLDLSSTEAHMLLNGVGEHRGIDLLDMTEEQAGILFDEVNATIYGSIAAGDEVLLTYVRPAFQNFDAYAAELTQIHEQFKQERGGTQARESRKGFSVDRELDQEIRQIVKEAREGGRSETEVRRAIRDTMDRALERQKEQQRATQRAARGRRSARELRERIERHVAKLSKNLRKPTDKQHIPEQLRTAVAAMLDAINLESVYTVDPETGKRRKGGEGDPTKRTEAFRALREQYEAILNRPDDYSYTGVLDPNLMDNLAEVIRMRDTPLFEMSLDQLTTVWQTVKGVEASITSANKLLGESRYAGVAELAYGIRESSRGKRQKNNYGGSGLGRITGFGDQLLNTDMMNSLTFLHLFGDGGDALYHELQAARDQKTRIMQETVRLAKQVVGKTNVDKLQKKIHTFQVEGGELKLSTAQLMSLYELNQRQQAQDHIYKGGIRPGPRSSFVSRDKSPGENVAAVLGRMDAPSSVVRVTQADVVNMLSELSEEEIRIADGLQSIMQGYLADEGNRESMKVYGYEKFTEDHYFPISSDPNQVQSKIGDILEGGERRPVSVSEWGSAKSTVTGANNGLLLGDIFDVFAQHAVDMSTYASHLGALEDVNRVRNFAFRNAEGHRSGTIKEIIQRVAGKGGNAYLDKLLQDISRGTARGGVAGLSRLTANYKAASVGLNLRVALQQPTSYARALAVMSPKYLADPRVLKSGGWKKALKYAPIAQWKDWGNFEINQGRQFQNILFDTDGTMDRLRNRAMTLASVMDSATWGRLWNACELEILDTRPSLQEGSEEFYSAVAQRFTDVVDQTQVVDNVLGRSQFMRSSDNLAKMAASYMGEPTQTYNMLYRAYRDTVQEQDPKKRSQAIKRLGRTAAAVTFSAFMTAVAAALWDGVRDDEDRDEKYWERVLKHIGPNFAQNVNPVGMLPYARDILSIVQGYDVSRMDLEAVTSLFSALQNMQKAVNGEGRYTIRGAALNLAAELARITGLPLATVKRDAQALARFVGVETEDWYFQYQVERALNSVFYSGNRGEFYDIAFGALADGDLDVYEQITQDLMSNGVKGSTIESAMRSRLKAAQEEDPSFTMDQAGQDLIGGRPQYHVEAEEKGSFSADDLSPEARTSYNEQRAGDYREWVDALEENGGFGKLDDEGKDKLLSAADQLASDTALRDHSQGAFTETDMDQWERWATKGAEYGVDPSEALLFKAAYDMAEGEKDEDGKTISGSRKENALELAADLMPWLTDRELEYLMSNYWAPEDRVLKEMKEGKFLG